MRFVRNPDGTPDGGVHDLFVITGRADAAAGLQYQAARLRCRLASNNVIFRIPTPTFGLGLVENVSDDNLEDALTNSPFKGSLGISGEIQSQRQ